MFTSSFQIWHLQHAQLRTALITMAMVWASVLKNLMPMLVRPTVNWIIIPSSPGSTMIIKLPPKCAFASLLTLAELAMPNRHQESHRGVEEVSRGGMYIQCPQKCHIFLPPLPLVRIQPQIYTIKIHPTSFNLFAFGGPPSTDVIFRCPLTKLWIECHFGICRDKHLQIFCSP